MARTHVFVDTGAWFSFVNARDPDHSRVEAYLNSTEGHLVTSSYVFDETITLTPLQIERWGCEGKCLPVSVREAQNSRFLELVPQNL